MQLVMVGNLHQRSYGIKTIKAQNTINLVKISGEMKTWNNFILRSKALIQSNCTFYSIWYHVRYFSIVLLNLGLENTGHTATKIGRQSPVY